jgi:hypothetical protein
MLDRFVHIAGLLVIILAWSCANPVAPTGGPKDEIPPEVVISQPSNQSINFQDDQIHLTFNEFVQLKNTNEQVIISPPFTENPEFQIRGKSVVISFNEALKENTTYTVFFGEAISDITENNPLTDYWYVFSTGTVIDSLSLQGKVLNAFNLQPEENVLVMLYESLEDSVPYKERPFYVSKTNKEGEFRFHNLRDQSLKMFALREANGNYLYDAATELIAFSDTLVKPYYIPATSIINLTDSAIPQPAPVPELTLMMFQETDSVQQLLESRLIQDGTIRIVFRFPAMEPVFRLLNDTVRADWCITEWNPSADTALLWLQPGLPDTLWMEVSDNGQVYDTARILLQPVAITSKPKKAEEAVKKLAVAPNIRSGSLDPFNPLILTFTMPVTRYDLSGIVLITETDTLLPSSSFIDPVNRKLSIPYSWSESTSCRLIIPDSTFYGISGVSHDSLTFGFRIRSLNEYGTITINITAADTSIHYILQLINEKEAVVQQKILGGKSPEMTGFIHLDPGKYGLKVIYDLNRNKRWDSGRYLRSIAPEKVKCYNKTLEIRGGWISEESWEL